MNQTNVLSLRVARGPQGPTDDAGRAKANGHRLGATEAGLPLTPQRLELVKAYANSALRHAPAASASQIAQRFAPRAEDVPPSGDAEPARQTSLVAPFVTLATGIRRLTAVLLLAALLPNVTLAAFWLRLIEPPWSRPVSAPASDSRLPAPQLDAAIPVLSAPARLEAAAGEDVPLPLALDGTDGVPAGSVIVVKGLPPGSSLSNGRAQSATDWTLRTDEIGDLHLVAPSAGSGESQLTIQLVAPNNGILADASTILTITGAAAAAIAGAATDPEPPVEIAAVVPAAATTDEPAFMSEPVPLPTRRPSPNAADESSTDWVRPSAYVNLRDGPSSTARAVSVVAKGTKLRVVARKRGWVQVSDPATSQSGWIYAGMAEAAP